MKLKDIINENKVSLTEATRMFVTTYKIEGQELKLYSVVNDKAIIKKAIDDLTGSKIARIVGRIAVPVKDMNEPTRPAGAADLFDNA